MQDIRGKAVETPEPRIANSASGGGRLGMDVTLGKAGRAMRGGEMKRSLVNGRCIGKSVMGSAPNTYICLLNP